MRREVRLPVPNRTKPYQTIANYFLFILSFFLHLLLFTHFGESPKAEGRNFVYKALQRRFCIQRSFKENFFNENLCIQHPFKKKIYTMPFQRKFCMQRLFKENFVYKVLSKKILYSSLIILIVRDSRQKLDGQQKCGIWAENFLATQIFSWI